MKYLVYRSFGSLDKDIKKHELIAVEFGKDIDAVTERLLKEVKEDMSLLPECKGWTVSVYAPEAVPSGRKVKRYDYSIEAVACYPVAPKHKRIEYGVIEKEEDGAV